MRETVGPEMGVKASGGIHNEEEAMAMIRSGCYKNRNKRGSSNRIWFNWRRLLNFQRRNSWQNSNKNGINTAIEALDKAYVPCPFSGRLTCLVTESGKIYQGINIENASF